VLEFVAFIPSDCVTKTVRWRLHAAKLGEGAGQLSIENMADKLARAVFGIFFGMFLIAVWPSLTA
jgi:hypothetical protein